MIKKHLPLSKSRLCSEQDRKFSRDHSLSIDYRLEIDQRGNGSVEVILKTLILTLSERKHCRILERAAAGSDVW